MLHVNDTAPKISTTDIFNTPVNLENYRGKKVLITFFRFSLCPFCNLRLHTLIKEYDEMGIEMIAFFESSQENMLKHLTHHKAPFSLISDKKSQFYHAYQINKSFFGMIKGMLTRPLEMMRGVYYGKFPFTIDGSMQRMPAEFLLDENGIIKLAYYAKDEGDHLDINVIKTFAKEK